jgi:hypothetical protein
MQSSFADRLTHWIALHPDAPYFIILLCLVPNDFTRQGESVGALMGYICSHLKFAYCRSNWRVPQILIQFIQFISSSSSRYSYTSCERGQFQVFESFLSIYDWLVAQTTKVIGAFKLFNRKFTILLGSVWIFRGTWSNELVSPR